MREPKTTVVIPTIPERATLLERAVSSVTAQSARCRIAVAEDSCDSGARATRQNGLETVTTEWVAFLDDDDELDPNHIEILLDTANRYKADFVWSRFRLRNDVKGTTTPGPYPLDVRAFEQWDDRYPVQTTITVLVRTDVALRAGGFHAEIDTTERLKYGQGAGEEFDLPFGAEGVAPSFGMPRTRLGPGITGEATQRAWQDDIETAIEHGDAEAGVIEAADA